MSIRIVNTNGRVQQRNDSEWRRATCSNIADKVDPSQAPQASQADVDAIASMMDSIPEESQSCQSSDYTMPPIEPRSQQYGSHYGSTDQPHMGDRHMDNPQLVQGNEIPLPQGQNLQPSKEQVAQDMINQYIAQNGGVPLPKEEKSKVNNKTLFG